MTIHQELPVAFVNGEGCGGIAISQTTLARKRLAWFVPYAENQRSAMNTLIARRSVRFVNAPKKTYGEEGKEPFCVFNRWRSKLARQKCDVNMNAHYFCAFVETRALLGDFATRLRNDCPDATKESSFFSQVSAAQYHEPQ